MKTVEYETYNNPVPLDLMKRGGLFNDMTFTLETAFLLSEAAFYHSIAGQNLAIFSIGMNHRTTLRLTYDVILFEFLGINNARSTVPNENIHTLCVGVNLVAPLHNCNSRPRRGLLSNDTNAQRKNTHAMTRLGLFKSDTKREIIWMVFPMLRETKI